MDGGGNVTQKYLTLPGDVVVTIKPQSTSAGAVTYSLPNIHGDIYLTVDADGQVKATHQTGPFGEALPGQTNPNNTASGTTWNYVGQHQKLTDIDTSPIAGGIIQMGARVYMPILGRFLSVDSVEGGTDNNYAYANDPVNQDDLDGKAIPVILGVVAMQVLPRVTIGLMVRVAVRSAVSVTTNYVAKKVAPVLFKKATSAASKALQVTRGAAGKAANKAFGYTSKLFGNPTLRNSQGQNAAKSGIFNKKWMPIRTGWSVGPKNKVMKPVFRTSIGYGKKAKHINWRYGRFY